MTGTLAIIGPGTLGCSLGDWAARTGFQVRLAGRNLEHARRGRERIEKQWQEGVRKGRITPGAVAEAQPRLRAATTWEEALDGAQIVLEALPEAVAVKAPAWRTLHQAAAPTTLRLTGSSSLPLAPLAEAAGLPGALLGFHLFVPVDRMLLLELVVPEGVPEALIQRTIQLGTDLGLAVVRVRDQPGYAASRMALAQGLEAMRLLEAGVASAEDLDTLMVKGYGHPVGPLALSDLIGLDLRLTIAEGIFRTQGDARFEPPALLRKLVAKGCTGRKSGQGFLTWTKK